MRVLLGWFAFSARLSLRLCRGGLRSVHACREVLLTRFALVHACCLSFDKQDGLRCLAFLFRRVEIAVCAFSRRSSVICLGGFTLGLCVYLWRSRRVTGDARNERTGLRGWRCGLCASLRSRIGLVMLSAGRTLGQNVEAALRPPQTAPKSQKWKRHCRLSGLSSRCGGAGMVRVRAGRRPGTRADLTGSQK